MPQLRFIPTTERLKLLQEQERQRLEVIKNPPVPIPDIETRIPEILYRNEATDYVPPAQVDLPQIDGAEPNPVPPDTRFPERTPTRMQQLIQPSKITPETEFIPPTLERKPEFYEVPKRLYETSMEKFGEVAAHVPLLPQALEFIAPAFEFIHEKLEKPFAAIITSPWSPQLAWKKGESWLDHEKREFETWDAPTYVKGAAEFAMPLWWMPWLGWAAKGAKALGVGNKMARAVSAYGRSGKIRLPSNQILNDTMYKRDFFKIVAGWAENKRGLHQIVKALGGESAFVKGNATTPLEIMKRGIANRSVIYDMRHGVRSLVTPKLQALGNPKKILQIDDAGRVGAAKLKKGVDDIGTGLSEVIEHPESFNFATKEAKAYVDQHRAVIKEIYDLAIEEGVKVPKNIMYHRIVQGKELTIEAKFRMAKDRGISIEQLEKELGEGVMELSEYGSLFEVGRHHKTMEGGIKAGVKYGIDPLESFNSTVNFYIKKIADKRFTDEGGKFGKKAVDIWADRFPSQSVELSNLIARQGAAEFALKATSSVLTRKGYTLPPATMTKIRNSLPDLSDRLEQAFVFSPQQVDNVISKMGREIWREVKMTPQEFKITLAQFMKTPGKILAREVDEAVRSLNASNRVAQKSIENVYKEAYLTRKDIMKEILTEVKNDADALFKTSKESIKPLKAQKADFLKRFQGQTALGEAQSVVNRHPAFRGKFFDKEVANVINTAFGKQGQEWIGRLGAVSGTSRMLVAAMDFSAPFIQGLSVLGRNPVAWTKGVLKQFEFFADPQKLYRYMTTAENLALRAERVAHGGSSATFEFFEHMKPLQNLTRKIGGDKLIAQTYGRAEAAFTGFGEVARNEMWKALRRPGMGEAELRELSRTIDRMTGVMSMESLGIGLTQRDFENAFVFFAPRYTRASLSFVADVFKGGISGANARQSLASLMASGTMFYYGASKALGQQPNFNWNSSKFMTLQIGDDRVGIGGILYGLMRFGASVAATATGDEPLDLVRLNRFDNPFIRFMFQRTSPLTGTVSNIIEGKNYFGEPFEDIGDWGKFIASKVTPIALQRAILEDEVTAPAPVFLSELGGMRTFPTSSWERREEVRDQFAEERHGIKYEGLSKLEQNQIDKEPSIQMLNDEADIRTAQLGGLSADFLKRQRERDDARYMYIDRLGELQRAIDVGVISGFDFKEEMTKSSFGLGATYEHIDGQERYNKVMKKLEEPRDMSNRFRGDVAYDELMEARYSDSFLDEFGIFQYDKYNDFIDNMLRKWGEDVMVYVKQRQQEGNAELPPMAKEFYNAREILRPYWQVQTDIERQMGVPQNKFQAQRVQGIVSKIRKSMKLSNPEIAKYHEMFYVQPRF